MKSALLLNFLSVLGLIILISMYLWAPSSEINKTMVLTMFILICLGGMMAASYPQYCLFNKTEKPVSTGHHPDCGQFHSHILTILNKKYCAGCSGLFLGAVLGIVFCLFYYIYGYSSPLLFWVGVITVFIALFQLNYVKIDKAPVKFISNLLLVTGSTSILLGILEYKPNLSLYFLVLIVLWIYTRTTNSATDHDLVCDMCSDASCPYLKN